MQKFFQVMNCISMELFYSVLEISLLSSSAIILETNSMLIQQITFGNFLALSHCESFLCGGGGGGGVFFLMFCIPIIYKWSVLFNIKLYTALFKLININKYNKVIYICTNHNFPSYPNKCILCLTCIHKVCGLKTNGQILSSSYVNFMLFI
jgi:hypothetical protein